MGKKGIILICVAVCIMMLIGLGGVFAYCRRQHKPAEVVDGVRMVFAIDLHGVLLHLSKARAVAYALRTPGKAYLLSLLASPLFWVRFNRVGKIAQSVEKRLELMCLYYPKLKNYQQAFINLCNQQDIDQNVYKLLVQLKARGHKLIVASNIGQKTYANLIALYPQLGQLFDAAFTSGEVSGFSKKPNSKFFWLLKNFVHDRFQINASDQHSSCCCLIDNNERNVREAVKNGIQAIEYSSSQQLGRELIVRGFLI